MRFKNDTHKSWLDRLEETVDLEHVRRTEELQHALWDGRKLPHLPCVINDIPGIEWPGYRFCERWDDEEKNLMTSLGRIYKSALIQDDQLYQVRPEYGVVNIPELFGVRSILTDVGNSMSEELGDRDQILRLVEKGVPDFDSCPHTRKILNFIAYAKETLRPYDRISKTVHFTLPDTQGPFDLASLIWGSDIFIGLYDDPDLLGSLLDLLTQTFIQYNTYMKDKIDEPMDSAYHIAGLKLVNGGIRICDDTATLISGEAYSDFVVHRNRQAFAPFQGGWLHYCGNGNHLLPYILNDMPGVNALHLGNPDMHSFRALVKETADRGIVLFWSGALEELPQALADSPDARLLVLLENRYDPSDLDDAKWRLEQVRNRRPVPKAAW